MAGDVLGGHAFGALGRSSGAELLSSEEFAFGVSEEMRAIAAEGEHEQESRHSGAETGTWASELRRAMAACRESRSGTE